MLDSQRDACKDKKRHTPSRTSSGTCKPQQNTAGVYLEVHHRCFLCLKFCKFRRRKQTLINNQQKNGYCFSVFNPSYSLCFFCLRFCKFRGRKQALINNQQKERILFFQFFNPSCSLCFFCLKFCKFRGQKHLPPSF